MKLQHDDGGTLLPAGSFPPLPAFLQKIAQLGSQGAGTGARCTCKHSADQHAPHITDVIQRLVA